MTKVDMERLDPDIDDGGFPPPLSEQIAYLNRVNAFLKDHAPAGQLTDFEFLPTDDFDSEPDPSSPEDEAADGDTPTPDEETAVK